MSDIFSKVMADVAVGFVQKFSSDALCLSFLEHVCSTVGLECTLTTDKSFRMLGDWKAMEGAHSVLQAVLEKYDAVTGTIWTDELSLSSLGTDACTERQIDDANIVNKPDVLVESTELEDSHQQESVNTWRTRRTRTVERKRDSRKERTMSKAKMTRNTTSHNSPDCQSLHKEKRNINGEDGGDDDGDETFPGTHSYFKKEAVIDTEELSFHTNLSASTTNASKKAKKKGQAIASERMQALRRKGEIKPVDTKGLTSEVKTSLLKAVKCGTKTEKLLPPRDRHSCPDCTFVASSKSALGVHRRKAHLANPAVCNVCGKMFTHQRYLRRHQSSHGEARHSCELCGKLYKGRRALMEHQQRHKEDYSKPALPCPQCPKTFCNQYLLSCHVRAFHEGQRQMFLCNVCGKSFTTKHSMQEHMHTHTGVKPYKCEECSKGFSYESALRDHRFIHKKVKQFSCQKCHKSFSQRSGLRVHTRIHEGIQQFQCMECGRAFTQKQALQRHERTHKGDKPFSCKLCGKTFIDASIIRRHLSLVHKIHKDSKIWREDIMYNPSNFSEGSLAVFSDPKQAQEHSTGMQGKVSHPGGDTSPTSLNHSNWCSDGADFSSPHGDRVDIAQGQGAGSTFPKEASGPWLTNPPQPSATFAPLDPKSLLHQANIIFPMPGSVLLPGTLLPFPNAMSLPPVTTHGGDIPAGQQMVVSPPVLHSPANHPVKVSDRAGTLLMLHEESSEGKWSVL